MNQKFGVGDVCIVRNDKNDLVKVVMPILDEDGSWWYEVEAADFDAPFHREVKQSDLAIAR